MIRLPDGHGLTGAVVWRGGGTGRQKGGRPQTNVQVAGGVAVLTWRGLG